MKFCSAIHQVDSITETVRLRDKILDLATFTFMSFLRSVGDDPAVIILIPVAMCSTFLIQKQLDKENTIRVLTVKPSECAIEFLENPSKVYHSGQSVSGKIKLKLYEKKEDVFAKIVGTAYVNWSNKDNNKFEGREIFFEKRTELIHESNGNIF